MPIKIKIEVNDREVIEIQGRNCGPVEGRGSSVRRYSYSAKSFGVEITGEVTHNRGTGVERLAGIILLDISNHKANPTDAAELLAARIREGG